MVHNSTIRRLGDVGDGFYRGSSFPQPATTPQRYPSQRERVNAPPHSMVVEAPPPSGLPPTSCSPQWNAPASHSGVQADCHGVPHNIWPDAQQSDPFLPAMNASAPYINQDQDMGNANGSTAYQQDNRIPVGTGRGPHGRLPPTGFQPEYTTEFVPARDMDGGQSAVGVNAQPFASTDGAEAPVISESLRFFARRYVLDPGTRIDTIHMGTSGYGRLKIVIMLDAVDSV